MRQKDYKEKTSVCVGGYLTVYLSIVLSIMLSIFLTMIEAVKNNTRSLEMEFVADIALNSVLAEYHRELLKQYDLFFVDTSYGSAYPDYEKTAAHLKKYLECNLGTDGIFLSFLYRQPVFIEVANVEIKQAAVASDEGGAVLRQQAVEVMKQKIGFTYLSEVQKWFDEVTEYSLDKTDIKKEYEEVCEELEEWDVTGISSKEEIEIPGGTITDLWKRGLLSFFIEDVATLSEKEAVLDNHLSHRERLRGTGPMESMEETWIDRLLFYEYILHYCGNYCENKEGGYFAYQTEYILCGKASDLGNLENCIYQILAIRGAANLVSFSSDTEKQKVTEAAATLLTALLGVPEAAEAVDKLFSLIWIMAESVYDVGALLDGEKVPLIKQKDQWHFDWDSVLLFAGKQETIAGESGLSYQDYLRLLLCFKDKTEITYRLMDIMEMDIRQTKGNTYFRMDGCIAGLTVIMTFSDENENEYNIERLKGYE